MKREESLGYQINHLARLLEQALRVRIAPMGVVPGQFAQLLALYERDEVTQNELREQVRIDQSTMAHTLNRMQRDGLIVRRPDPTDGRKALIALTAHAHSLEVDLVRAADDVNAAASQEISDQEMAQYLELTARLIANLEAHRTAPTGGSDG
ncbi:MarR family winged helix-turn-helix transcriptional regulator [Nocardia wallacei]|uniref:MarR family winged helix-turn-helix transcriptional regulator n=1 Tax=Nocardia wallacei TaxID=480035 RepID=UPI002453A13C|nr:MarR family winged helix-turn-helix transcriptional regulator [Nocardia wallacei]